MATYKVLQDIEAEDKFIGPLTLKQFIYASVTAVCLYLSVVSVSKGLSFLLAFLLPPAAIAAVFAWPWSKEQPTETWLLAKLRFYFKSRKRVWSQDGVQQLVTITAPKRVERVYSNNLSQYEVRSRLRALADTIDSRGWAIKNANVNMFGHPALAHQAGDRLIDMASLPQEVSITDIQASDDMLDERNNPTAAQLDQLISASNRARREQIIQNMHPTTQPAPTPAGGWFTPPAAPVGPVAPVAAPISPQDEQALLDHIKQQDDTVQASFAHLKTIQPLNQPMPDSAQQQRPAPAMPAAPATSVPPQPSSLPANSPAAPSASAHDPAILELANNDDLNVATIARQAKKARDHDSPSEVVISLR